MKLFNTGQNDAPNWLYQYSTVSVAATAQPQYGTVQMQYSYS